MSIRNKRATRDHRYAYERLSIYMDGELRAKEQRRVRRHLDQCPECRAELASLQETVSLLGQLPMPPLPRSFVLPRSVQKEQQRFRRWDTSYGVLRTASVVVAIMLALFVSGDFVMGRGIRFLRPQPMVIEMADELPAEPIVEHETFPEAAVAAKANSEVEPAVPDSVQVDRAAEKAMPPAGPSGGGVLGESESAPQPLGALVPEQPAAASPAEMSEQPKGPPVRALAPTLPKPKTSGAQPKAMSVPDDGLAAGEMAAGEEQPEVAVEALLALTPTPLPQPTALAPETGKEAPVAIALVPSEPEPTAPASQAQAPLTSRDTGETALRWAAWKVLRTVAITLFGLLLMLLAGLIWVAQKRHA